jgi:hypothetical protein
MTYQSSLPEVKTIFDDYPAHLCMSKMIQTREELINEFKQTKLGAHWFECILLPEGLEKVGKYLINHRDTISVDEESHFFYLLDEICIMTDILQGNISKYWLNVEFEDAESTQCKIVETNNKMHQANPVVDAIKELTGVVKESLKTPKQQFTVYPQPGSTANLGCDQKNSDFKTYLPKADGSEEQSMLESNKKGDEDV